MTTVAVRSAYRATTAKEGGYGYDSRTLNSEPDELLKILSFCGLVKKRKEWIRNNILFLRYYDMHMSCAATCCLLAN
jgi:hypothetical protein